MAKKYPLILNVLIHLKGAANDVKLVATAPDLVDELYLGCPKEAKERILHSGLLQKELKQSASFQGAWRRSPNCSRLIPGGTMEHTDALSIYDFATDFKDKFNNEVQATAGNYSIYEEKFPFKTFRFLLMDSMRLLKPKQCKNVYLAQDKSTLQQGATVRFESFTSVSSDADTETRLEDMDGRVLLNITSCFFANLKDHLCKTNMENSILLSPAEVFTVESVEKVSEDEEYTLVALKHSKLGMSHSCHILSR